MWTWSTSNDSSVSDAALGPAPRAELLHILMLPDVERAERIGEFCANPESRAFAELLIRLRGGSDAPGGAGRDAAGGRSLKIGEVDGLYTSPPQ